MGERSYQIAAPWRSVDGAMHRHVRGNQCARCGGFEAACPGTWRRSAAATAGGVRRFVHSSLAAREPRCRLRCIQGEVGDVVERRGRLGCAAPAVLERATRTLSCSKGQIGVVCCRSKREPVDDPRRRMARLLLALAGRARDGQMSNRRWARCGGTKDLTALAGGREARCQRSVSPRIEAGSQATAPGGEKAKLTPDRAAYFSHPDWVADPSRSPPARLWRPTIETNPGLSSTAAWYRAQGWL